MARRLFLPAHLTLVELEQRYRCCRDPVERGHWPMLWLLSSDMPTVDVARVRATRCPGCARSRGGTALAVPPPSVIGGMAIPPPHRCSIPPSRSGCAAYGDHYERMARIKAKYVPTNLFRLNQNIKPV